MKQIQYVTGLNTAPDDTYFIRRNSDNFYLHFAGDLDPDNVIYLFKPTIRGACGWKLKNAESFIRVNDLSDIASPIKFKDVLPQDGSMN